MNIFEYASRNTLRLTSVRGPLTVEQLWMVPLRSRDAFNLNSIAQAASAALKGASTESFVDAPRTGAHTRLEVALELVKHVIRVKLEEEARAKRRAENAAKRERLLELIAERQDGKLSSLTEEELKAQLKDLEDGDSAAG